MTISLEVQRGNMVGVGKRGNSIQQGAGIHGETCGTVRKASKFMCLTHSEAKEYQNVKSLEQRNAYCRALQEDGLLMSLKKKKKTPELPKPFR